MFIAVDFPVARAVAAQRVTTMTSVSFDANDSGVNLVICRVSASALKKAGTSMSSSSSASRPCRQ